MHTGTPKHISQPIAHLAQRLVPGATPEFVQILPTADGAPNECFASVALQVEKAGGRVQHGWAIWEWPNVLIEAEFHAVWASPTGHLIDVTPRNDSESRILFLADPERTFEGVTVDNVRAALRDDPRVHEFIRLAEQRYRVLNKGDRAFQFGTISVPRHEIQPILVRMAQLEAILTRSTAGRNDPCPCGSGRKYKRCHGA
jgi:hypothetical protein